MIENPAIPGLGTSGEAYFGRLIPALLSGLLVLGGIFFVFTLLMGGVAWITAGGDKGKIEAAREKVTNAVIGIVVLFAFFAILNVVECFFGIGFRSFTIAAFDIRFAGTPVCN